jgi:5-amino-6-(5-phospho-D-ribitylamino)uracil phosphatase
MSTLYISDLDGTLLNRQAELSPYSLQTLNQLLDQGLSFSFATARTAASALKILRDVRFRLPVILMNGVIIYDWPKQRVSKVERIDERSLDAILVALQRFGVTGFMYAMEGEQLTTCYTQLSSPLMVDFYEERRQKYYKSFEQVRDFEVMRERGTIYCTLIDSREVLEPIRDFLADVPGLACTMYKCIYAADAWYLEIFSANASKENAVRELRQRFQFDRVVGFGDNLNDLSLFRACDVKYAMRNAQAELKAAADAVIGTNDEDSVARFLADIKTIS